MASVNLPTAKAPDSLPFKIGDPVRKTRGYLWPGEVRAVFTTIDGEQRIVVQCTVPEVSGALHIFNSGQLQLWFKDDH